MPRSLGRVRSANKNIAALVLAAGSSKRMGDANKLTLSVDGTPMVARAVDSLRKAGVGQVVVVTGHDREGIVDALDGRDVELVHNAHYDQGMGTSIRTGVGSLSDDVDGALIALGDMPWVDEEVIGRLTSAFSPGGEHSIYIPVFGMKRGNPVLWAARHFEDLAQLDGDVGGRALFHRYEDAICYVEVKSAAVNIDIDTPDQLHGLGIEDRGDGERRGSRKA